MYATVYSWLSRLTKVFSAQITRSDCQVDRRGNGDRALLALVAYVFKYKNTTTASIFIN